MAGSNIGIESLIEVAHFDALAAGWWEEAATVPPALKPAYLISKLALIDTEIAEAIEEVRVGFDATAIHYEGPNLKPVGIASELADAVIRIADLCGHYKIPLGQAISEKLAFNRTRGHRHGGKKA